MTATLSVKEALAAKGRTRVVKFCEANSLRIPEFKTISREVVRSIGGTCAYYRPQTIYLNVAACAAPGHAGRCWSWPGYVIDRTPFGVYAHELGHHADWSRSTVKGRYSGDLSIRLRKEAGEEQLTGYCDNDGEWFAEMFRLFVTNPDLLRCVRPKTFELLCGHFTPVVKASWRVVLRNAPQRTVDQAEKKVRSI